MDMMTAVKNAYVKELKRRGKESHVYRKYQLIGLEISQMLHDEKHKALYIKLAKDSGAASDRLLGLAKDIAGRTNVKNKGAYFMSVLKNPKN
jgi:hypothetical protein